MKKWLRICTLGACLAALAAQADATVSAPDSVTDNPRTVVVPSGGAKYTANFSPLGTVLTLANPTDGGSAKGGGLYLVGSNATVTMVGCSRVGTAL